MSSRHGSLRGWLVVTMGLLVATTALALLSPAADADDPGGRPTPKRPAALAPHALSPLQGGHLSEGDPRSSVIMPEQRIDLRFNHAVHLGEVGLECTDCHDTVASSKNTRDLNLPAKAKCMDCHDAEEIPGDWGRGVKNPLIDMPPANLHFSHQLHLGAGVKCESATRASRKVSSRRARTCHRWSSA